jgi:hypothetical protein
VQYLAKSEAFQTYVTLCKAFPGLGTPSQAAIHYGHFPAFMDNASKDECFRLDIMSLVEHQRKEKEATDKANEEREKQRKEVEDMRRMPGMVRRLTMEQLIERQKREAEKKGAKDAAYEDLG